MIQSADIVIVGGAVMGCAAAYYLSDLGGSSLRILVAEKDPTYGRCSTTLSVGSIRQQFSTPLNIAMSRFGLAFIQALNEGASPGLEPVPFTDGSYLFLATVEGVPTLDANLAVQEASGVAMRRYDVAGLATAFPWLNTEGLGGGAQALAGEGWFDGYALLQAIRRRCRDRSVAFMTDEVVGFERQGNRLQSAVLKSGSRVLADRFVNAAGPAAGAVAALAGMSLPVRPRKRCVFHVKAAEAIGSTPLVIDPSGFYFRPEGKHGFVCGMAPDADPDVDLGDFDVPPDLFETQLWPRLAHRVPAFNALRVLGCWAGHYEVSTIDQNAIIGPPPEPENLYFLNGFSGHGLQHAAAAGRGIAELILSGRYQSLDLTPLGFERVLNRRPLSEQAVIG